MAMLWLNMRKGRIAIGMTAAVVKRTLRLGSDIHRLTIISAESLTTACCYGKHRLHLCRGVTHFSLDNERLTFTLFFGDFWFASVYGLHCIQTIHLSSIIVYLYCSDQLAAAVNPLLLLSAKLS